MADVTPPLWIDPSGNVSEQSGTSPADLATLGYVPASPEQIKDFELNKKFSTGAEQLKTAGEGALQSLTLGLSTPVETALGVSPEDIKAREQANPLAHGTGEALGVLAPLLTGFGEVTAPGLIGKAGTAAGELAGGALPEATTALGRIGVRAAKSAATGATEAGLFQVGHLVHESALGDPNLTAQSALEQVGLASLFGGTLGGTLGGLAGVGKEFKLGERASDWLSELEGNMALRSAHAVPKATRDLMARMGEENVNSIGREGQDLGILGPFKTPKAISDAADEVMDKAYENQSLAVHGAISKGAKPRSWVDIVGRIDKEVIADLEESPLREGAANVLQKHLANWGERLAAEDGGNLTLKGLWDFRKLLDSDIKGLRGVFDPTGSWVKGALYDARRILSKELNDGFDQIGMKEAWAKANRAYHVAATIGELADKGAARMQANNPISLISILTGLAGFAHGVPTAALMGIGAELAKRFGPGLAAAGMKSLRGFVDKGAAEAVVNKTAEAIANERMAGANKIAASASSQGERVAALSQLERANMETRKRIDDLVGKVMSGAGRAVRSSGAIGAQLGHTEQEQADNIRALANNPQLLHDRLLAQTADLHEHAPDVSQAFQLTAARAIGHLATHAPGMPQPGPLAPKLHLTKQQKWEWNRRVHMVNKPTALLEHAAFGTLTPMDVSVVKEVHPELYAEMSSRALAKVAAAKEPISYGKRLMLSILTGENLDGSLSPQSIVANQMAFQMPSQKPGMDGQTRAGISQTGLSKVKVGDRMRTPGQAADARMENA